MIYEYQAEDGSTVEIEKPVSQCDYVGKVIVHEGRRLKRVASRETSSPPVWKPYISNRLPRNVEGCKCDPQGKPIIETQAQEREVAARLGWSRE